MGRKALELIARRLFAGRTELAQVWFDAAVLDRYRQAGARLIRTNTVGQLRGTQWMVDFGIAGEGETLIHLSVEALQRIPESERDHWTAHLHSPPASANFLLMQATRGACIDDGDVRPG